MRFIDVSMRLKLYDIYIANHYADVCRVVE
jgi:hypothetical protein